MRYGCWMWAFSRRVSGTQPPIRRWTSPPAGAIRLVGCERGVPDGAAHCSSTCSAHLPGLLDSPTQPHRGAGVGARAMHVAVAIPPTPRRAKPVRRFPPEVLVRALLDSRNTPPSLPGLRNRAPLTFLYRTGLRPADRVASRAGRRSRIRAATPAACPGRVRADLVEPAPTQSDRFTTHAMYGAGGCSGPHSRC